MQMTAGTSIPASIRILVALPIYPSVLQVPFSQAQLGCLDHLYYNEHVHYERTDTLNAETSTGESSEGLQACLCMLQKSRNLI